MNLNEINKDYFSSGTRGYKIINSFYNKYYDLFKSTIYNDFGDFSNQIFLNISKIDLSKNIRNAEAYLIGSIKIQCRVLLDKAVKTKNIIPESRLNAFKEEDSEESFLDMAGSDKKIDQQEKMDAEELFNLINTFKVQLNRNEVQILNYLISEKSRHEIAEEINLNLNTIDTHIRRLRIKFSKFLIRLGYTDNILEKYT
jgi:DNA-directed RNA polymerase specialized sigma24 family protein